MTEPVLRLLRDEELDYLSREQRVVAATLSLWRDSFLDGGSADTKSRPTNDRDELAACIQAKVGQVTLDNEWLGQKCRHLESDRPFAARSRCT